MLEQTEKRSRASRLDKDQFLQLLVEYEKTPDQTLKEFCSKQGINRTAFYYYRSRYQPQKSPNKKATSGFITITAPVQKEPSPPLFAEVKGIKIYQAVPADYLKTLAS